MYYIILHGKNVKAERVSFERRLTDEGVSHVDI